MENSDLQKKVLVVDDEANVRESLRLILSRTYSVEVAEDGEQASQMLAGSSALPDLILMDVMMPGVDGIELLKKVKAEHPDLPVLMLSANTRVPDK